jgi:hypothetical protein
VCPLWSRFAGVFSRRIAFAIALLDIVCLSQ